jgi:2-methylcitrate dehydratase PrpD
VRTEPIPDEVVGKEYTSQLVSYAAGFGYESLPVQAILEAKTIVLDTLGAILAGSHPMYSSSRLVGDLASLMGGKPECTVIGRDFKTSAESAALANGTMGYAADIEGGGAARQHVPAVLVPTALVMGERQHSSGKAFLAALALGYEIGCRVSEACRTPRSYPHSFHPSANFGFVGAAATAGHLLGLDEVQYGHAFGIAASTAGGLITWVNDPTEDTRPFVIGLAARGGVTAALLAGMGFGGPARIFDPGTFDIYDAYAGEMHPERLLEGLGNDLWILKTGGFKRYPCCGDIHTGLDGLLAIRSEEKLAAEDILQVVHRVKKDRAPVIDGNLLRSHCAQYIMAAAAVDGKLELCTFLRDRSGEPSIREMMKRVTLRGDAELDTWTSHAPAVVEVTTKDGRRLVRRVDWPRGSKANPMTRQELEDKFYWLASTVMTRGRAERIAGIVERLEELPDLSELTSLLAAEK